MNENLELLLGQLHLAEELCDDEVDKLYNGKESLTEVCHALECTITPVAQKGAQYVNLVHYILKYFVSFKLFP